MIYSRESIHSLKNLVNPSEILNTVGNIPYSCITDSGSEVRCPCPIHRGDQSTGFSWKKSDGIWSCFTKKCGEDSNIIRDVYGFVMLKKGLSFSGAVKYVADMHGFSLQEGDINSLAYFYLLSDFKKQQSIKNRYRIERLEELKELPGYYNDKKAFEYVNKYLFSRGYKDLRLLEDFNLYPCIDSLGSLRVGIPSYDEDGRLVGVNSRRLDGILSYRDGEPKYRMISGYKKGSVLYNLNKAKHFSQQRGLIVVEGEFSAIRVVTYGIPNVVCTMGNIISSKQLPLIYKNTYHLIFLLEEGEAAIEGVHKSIANLIPNSMRVSIAKLPSGDPDDNSKQTILQCLENKRTLSNQDILGIKNGFKLL